MGAGPKVQCPVCKAVMQSMHRHDYKVCGCPNRAMVDGGDAYLRRGCAVNGKPPVVIDKPDVESPPA